MKRGSRIDSFCVRFCIFLFLWTLVALTSEVAGQVRNSGFKYRQITIADGLPSDEVQKVHQDRDGFLWFATRYGLCRFDGYQMTVCKSDLHHPDILTSNDILCLADDADGFLWIGTREGLNRVDRHTGEMRQWRSPSIPNNLISCLLVTRKNEVWIGTDSGLCRYVPEEDSIQVYDEELTGGVLGKWAVKALYEDEGGDLWIGTWSSGLFRYSSLSGEFFAYPQLNERNSAHVIYQDTRGNIWVAGWDSGLTLLHHPKEMDKVAYTRYVHQRGDDTSLQDDIVYALTEDVHSGSLWIGMRSGLSTMDLDEPGRFVNYSPGKNGSSLPCDEINSLLRDRSDNIWMGTLGGGVLMTSTKPFPFIGYRPDLTKDGIHTSEVHTLFADADNNLWMGIGTYGLALQKYRDEEVRFYTHIPEFSDIEVVETVNAIIQRNNGDIWFGTHDGGVLVYRKGEKVRRLRQQDMPSFYSDCITALYEDRKGNCWIGCRGGLGVSLAGGEHHKFEALAFENGGGSDWYQVMDICEDRDGSIWVATSNCGILHLVGNVQSPRTLKCYNYSFSNRSLSTNTALCFHIDRFGRLWAGTEGGGLLLYDRRTDAFIEMNRKYDIPGDRVGTIEEDETGALWLGTNVSLIRLQFFPGDETPSVRTYTTSDGLLDNSFSSNAVSSCRRGEELLFSGHSGYNRFSPMELKEEQEVPPFYFTDIRVFNRPFIVLEEEVRARISPKLPSFTDKIVLSYLYNNFSIEFAALTYLNPELNRYAYQLEGFDDDWQYVDAKHRHAFYNNLESGTYRFRLRATNENGVWSKNVRELKVVILPPPWQTWWAYLLYVIFGLLVGLLIFRVVRNRIRLVNALRLQELEKSKSEELNHAKLQFFTNVTHELLTPLTIISASVDELKTRVPGHEGLYGVISTNIRRLIRLLQQILEFRKAESGNLKLCVSQGDIAAFVQREFESFLPLAKKRDLHFSLTCQPKSIIGFFDSDKLDKIIYNLLSNAAKYNREGGRVQVSLSFAIDCPECIRLSVKDDGPGIPKERQKNLFRRFYEGDYRKFNTIGTGIGLSLTKDLVELHKGTITVESEKNQGTEFVVILPIARGYFEEEQINEELVPEVLPMEEFSTDVPGKDSPAHAYTVLLVEDNEELLQLMKHLLQRAYRVVTARNGQDAVTIVNNEEVDLIVTDVMMPVMDGIELCKFVKSKLEYSHIPIILLTVKNREEDRAEAYEVGADAFISKPFHASVLRARIRNLLKTRERMMSDFRKQFTFQVKDLEYTDMDKEFVQRAIDCITRHAADEKFDQLQFADEMGTSKSTLYRKLKSLTGMTTTNFIRNVRLKAACRLLEERKDTIRISELAYSVGFSDPKYFSVCFKKEFGVLPTEYLEHVLQKK